MKTNNLYILKSHSRYGGFCPQFKYQIGETFGKTTSKLLRDDAVASSGSLVLASIRANSAPVPPLDPREALLRSRTHSWGDQKLMEQMIPGYTGLLFYVAFARSLLNVIPPNLNF